MSEIGNRLREERERLGLSQTALGELAGVKKNAQFNYEAGNRSPDSEYLSAVAEHGVDILYVVTGRRMSVSVHKVIEWQKKYLDLLKQAELGESIEQLEEAEAAAGGAKERENERLAAAIAAVEEGLAGAGRSLDPDRKAELILAAYDLLEEDTPSYRDRIVRLVRAS